jgi:lysophospholipase L1-like esterase
MVVTWRSNGSDVIVRVNGQQYNLGSAFSSFTVTSMRLCRWRMRAYEFVVCNTDIGATNLTNLEGFLTQAIGTSDTTRTVALLGDSITAAYTSQTFVPWHDPSYVTNRSGSLWYTFGGDGVTIASPGITAANLASLNGATEAVVILYIGTNDIIAGQTGAQAESNISTYCTTLKNAGCKVLVCTLQAFVTNNAERLNLNTLLKANYATYASGIIKLDEAAQLSDSTNTTYFAPDGIHLVDGGLAVVGGLAQTALAAL